MKTPIRIFSSIGLLITTLACLPGLPKAPITGISPSTIITTLIANSPGLQVPLSPLPPRTAIPPDLAGKIDSLLNYLTDQGAFSGSVLIARQGQVILNQGYGLANCAQNIANGSRTRFLIGSLTQQFTAMAILILEAQGKLDIQAPVCNYLDRCPAAWEEITLHHLLTHSSGLPPYDPSSEKMGQLPGIPAADLVIEGLRSLPLEFSPGENWLYTDAGYNLLGAIIEQVSGQSYEAFLQRAIFTPLHLQDTGIANNLDGLAVEYDDQETCHPAQLGEISEFAAYGKRYAATDMYSSSEDLYRWDQALYTEQLVPKESLLKMFYSDVLVAEQEDIGTTYGYGWYLGIIRGHRVAAHEGALLTISSSIQHFPDDQVTIILLSNNQALGDHEKISLHGIEDILFSKIFGAQYDLRRFRTMNGEQ